MTVHIKLYSTKASKFREIKAQIEEELGFEPSNPEVVGILMNPELVEALDLPVNSEHDQQSAIHT